MFKLTGKLASGLIFDEIELNDNQPNDLNTSNPIRNDHSQHHYLTSKDIISPIPSISPVKSSAEWEQLRQTQECLETSASYMNEIESFFQELSTQRPTPMNNSGWISAESSTFSLESYENLDFDNLNANAIDPAIFNLQELVDEEEVQFPADNFSNILHFESTSNPKRSSKASNKSNQSAISSPSTSTDSSRNFKAPKFYSRSGQIADPNRGPCHNCHTTLTCYWRKLKGQYHCNACTLFFKRNKYHRSGDAADKPIKRRNRKSKYSQ